MRSNAKLQNRVADVDAVIEPILNASRVPGAAVAIVLGGETVYARGFGYRDLTAKLSMTSKTAFPIASTTKALNATVLGMLVDEGLLDWDTPVQEYMPNFCLPNPNSSAQVTVRDLIAMRTGLPRHDWVWIGRKTDRAELVRALAFLDSSAGFRDRFQYNNLTVTAAGHVAEVLTGHRWEDLVRARILEPLSMKGTVFGEPPTDEVTLSYHENNCRELITTRRLASEATAPSGGSIHSTIEDMTHWLRFNLGDGRVAGRRLIESHTLREIHSPCVATGDFPGAPSPNATYALGWFVDTYQGHSRISHGGYLHDVESSVMLFPETGLGLMSFINFGPSRLASTINQRAFELLIGVKSARNIDAELAKYEERIEETRARIAAIGHVAGSAPSHPLDDYTGTYEHAAYGRVEIRRCDEDLVLERYELILPLEHWHCDAWVAKDNDLIPIDMPHAFDRTSQVVFNTNASGEVGFLTILLEPAVAPICFYKHAGLGRQ
jgi:CubicO group peptidase (beta-lactamase class C family)